MTARRVWLDPFTGGGRSDARYIDIEPGRYFALVILDRDEMVYNARADDRLEDAELRLGFPEAIEHYLSAAHNYLWVHGYPGSFGHGTGPAVVYMPAPFHLADQLAVALRFAEIEGDFTELYALTTELSSAVPLDRWLGPGERLLHRGTDFTATPSAFLAFLRAKARKRGLRLNGRAEPGGVWVRPTMPRQNQELRKEWPAQYSDFVDPAPYVEHVEPDGAPLRPFLDHSRADPVGHAEPVTFLPAALNLDRAHQCPCGFRGGNEDPGHNEAHLWWSMGVPIPKNVPWFGEDIAVVTATSPVRLRKLAYRCAILPRRENGYDFASFAVGDGTPDDTNSRAYLYRHRGRVIGFVSVFDSDQARWYPFVDGPVNVAVDESLPTSPPEPVEAVPRPDDGRLRPVVHVVFTADVWRRHGVARELIGAIAADKRIDLTDLAWNGPFSTSGLKLAKSMDPSGGWLI